MSRRLSHIKNIVQEKRLINKEKRNRCISIESELQYIERKRTIYFLLGGGDLKLNYVCILDDSSYRILVAKGEIVHAENPKVNYRLMIDNIVSDLKSRKIRSHQRYNAKEFYEKYLKEFSSKENLQKLEASAIESIITELPDLNQVIEEIKKSNASHKITPQNIENVKDMTNILGGPILRDMSVRRPKLLETFRSNKENMGVLAVVVALLAAVSFKYRSCNRKSKGHSSSKEEIPSSNLLSAITLESGANCIS